MSETYVGELVAIPPWPKTMKAALRCDGKAYRVEDYPELFEVIGYLYGGSDGVFNVPPHDTAQHYAIRTHSSGGTGSASGSTREVQ